MKSPLLFSVHASNDSRFCALTITIHTPKEFSKDSHCELMRFEWQANADDRSNWYAFQSEIRFRDVGDYNAHLKKASKLAAKLFTGKRDDKEPGAIIEVLAELGIERAAYDSRVSRLVRESQAIDPALVRYLDDWTQYDSGRPDGCTVSALARDEAHAKAEIATEFLKNALESGRTSMAEQFAQWVAAGKPVRVAYQSEKPASYPSLPALLNTPIAEAA